MERVESGVRKDEHSDDYLYRLAEQICQFLADNAPGEKNDSRSSEEYKAVLQLAWRAYEVPNTPEESLGLELRERDEKSGTWKRAETFAGKLERHPKIQCELSYRVDYTPSRWVLEREIYELRELRKQRSQTAEGNEERARTDPYGWMFDNRVTGLCFSGGGIRSATFNLGVLQGLAQHTDSRNTPLLKRIDYLSTVSGGGYIHEFFAAWVKRNGFDDVAEKLVPPPAGHRETHAEPLKWLRRYSNYLTPQTGFFTADTWVAAAIWMRNTFLNQIVLVSMLATLVLAPHLFVKSPTGGTDGVPAAWWSCPGCGQSNAASPRWDLAGLARVQKCFLDAGASLMCLSRERCVLLALALAAFVWGIGWMSKALAQARLHRKGSGGQGMAQGVVILLLISGFFVTRLAVLSPDGACLMLGCLYTFVLLFATNVVMANLGGAQDSFPPPEPPRKREGWWTSWSLGYWLEVIGYSAASAVGAAAAFGLVWWGLVIVAPKWLPSDVRPWTMAIVVGPPLFLGIPFLSQVLLAGLVGRDFEDWLREWLGRVRAWSFLIAGAWLALFGVSLFGHMLAGSLAKKTFVGLNAKWSAIVGWLLTTGGSVLAGKSDKTTGTPKDSGVGRALNVLAVVGPYVFIAGLMVSLAWCVQTVLHGTSLGMRWAVYLGPALVFVLFGRRVDINEFSMHVFYRNRLTRCYLGASRGAERRPDPLTGFDDQDTKDTKLAEFLRRKQDEKAVKPEQAQDKGYTGPYPIFCGTLNLSFGEDLAWQERKAASFAFTPLYCGYHVGWTAGKKGDKLSYNGYAPTSAYAYPGGVNMATAVAACGAAVSPNWGYHTNPATAFLLTMFNVRLGWWIRNPRKSDLGGKARPAAGYKEERPSPRFPARQLTRELLGEVDDTSQFVYVTDGGHFENMGLYELVRRRCRTIVVCDAEQDGEFQLDGIARAIRLCNVDFGAEIDLDLEPLRPHMDEKLGYAVCRQHFAKGTIRYPGRRDRDGEILYIKASLTGQEPYFGAHKGPPEPGDLMSHKLRCSDFPHDPTANQWFGEELFESYRRLGLHVVEEIESLDIWRMLFDQGGGAAPAASGG